MTQKDPNQIVTAEHNEELNAKRVVIVGGGSISMTADMSQVGKQLGDILKENTIQKIEVPVIVKEIQIIEKPVVYIETRFEIIEKPIIVKEFETIEKQVIVKETVFEKIEKPVYIDRIRTQTMIPGWCWLLLGVQTALISALLVIKH